jgi:hypothetical protein
VIIKAESGMDNSDVYSIQVKTEVANVQTEDIQTIATGISFQRKSSFPLFVIAFKQPLYSTVLMCRLFPTNYDTSLSLSLSHAHTYTHIPLLLNTMQRYSFVYNQM